MARQVSEGEEGGIDKEKGDEKEDIPNEMEMEMEDEDKKEKHRENVKYMLR